ncbi:rod-binding protein [Candidatus Aerophobetes bacterium]|nr:rod-binding protein [Candidatus Aerophobetes bacterium]
MSFSLNSSIYPLSTILNNKLNLNYSLRNEDVIAKKKNLKEVCSQFEGIFLTYLFRQMENTLPKSTLFGEGLTQKFFKEEWYQAMAQRIAKEGGIGLTKILYEKLKGSE